MTPSPSAVRARIPSYPERERQELAAVEALWEKHGRDKNDLYSVCAVGGRVLDEGERPDSPKVLAQAGPLVAIAFHAAVEDVEAGVLDPQNFPFPEELEAYRKVYQTYQPEDARYISNHRGHLMFVRPDEAHISGDVIKGMSLTGTRAEIVDRLQSIKSAGYKQIQFHLVPGHENEMMERWIDIMGSV